MITKEKELRRQRAQEKRGLYKRKRKKKFQRLKHTGQSDQYSKQKAGFKTVRKIVRSSEGSGVPQLSWQKRLSNFIKKFFKRI